MWKESTYQKIVYGTSFLLGTPFSTYSIYYVQAMDIVQGTGFCSGIYHSSESGYGVRPLIII